MMKQPCDEHNSRTNPTHQVEDQNNCLNYRLFDSHKTINQGEDFPGEEDSPEEEDFPEEGEDSLEEEDTQAEEEYHPEDHPEASGDRHRCRCPKPNKGNW